MRGFFVCLTYEPWLIRDSTLQLIRGLTLRHVDQVGLERVEV